MSAGSPASGSRSPRAPGPPAGSRSCSPAASRSPCGRRAASSEPLTAGRARRRRASPPRSSSRSRRGGGGSVGRGAGGAAAGAPPEWSEPRGGGRVSFGAGDRRNGFALDLRAVAPPAELSASDPAGKLGGMEGYEQLVAVEGVVTVGGTERRFRGQGQRGHSWGAPDWDRLPRARAPGGWFEGGTGVTATAVRPAKATSHADEAIHAVLLEQADDDDGRVSPVRIADPRLSTTHDGDGRQRHAGLELYIDADDDFAHRAAGEVACGTTLDLGRLRLDCAFFRWRMEGRTGVGRYDLLRRVDLA